MTESGEEQPNKARFWENLPAEVMKSGLVNLISKGIFWLIVGILFLLFALISDGADMPVAATVAIVFAVSIGLFLGFRRSTTRLRARNKRLTEENKRLSARVDRYGAHSAHVGMMLDHLHQVIGGKLKDVTIPDFLEQGILAPARDMLLGDCDCDVRLSILLPDKAHERFTMGWAAGHSFESKQKYNVPIADTLARLPYADGFPYDWADVTADNRFKPNPRATRPFHSMVSIPIKHGDEVQAVFNVIWADRNAYDDTALNYITSLGAVIQVAVSAFLKDAQQAQRSKKARRALPVGSPVSPAREEDANG